MIRLRPYNANDADKVLSWSRDEGAFYKWSAGVLGKYPITKEQFGFVNNLMAFTAIDDDDLVGFFTMRRPTGSYDELRFGFVVVDPDRRGKGYGKAMLQLGTKFAKEIYGAKKVSLGVFEKMLIDLTQHTTRCSNRSDKSQEHLISRHAAVETEAELIQI